MKLPPLALRCTVGLLLTLVTAQTFAADPTPKPLLNPADKDAQNRLTPSSDQVKIAPSTDPTPGLVVTIEPGKEGYPGVNVKPEGATTWDLSGFGHVDAKITNLGAKNLTLILRVDNPGDWRSSPWKTEKTTIKPGATGTVTVIFGYDNGYKPGYALKPATISNLLLFTTKSADPISFRIDSITAAGAPGEKPPETPASVQAIRVKPGKDGVILGKGMPSDAPLQVTATGGVKGAIEGETAKITFPAGNGVQAAAIKLAKGAWNLTHANVIRVKVKNLGQTAVTPGIQATSQTTNGTPIVSTDKPLAPGAEAEIVVPFAPAVPWKGPPMDSGKKSFENLPGTGTKYTSDATDAIKITAKHNGGATLQIISITADAPPAVLPDWLGKRPPVEGDWVKTFDDEFDGTTIDQTKWAIYGPNFWDKKTHWSKDNLILGDGVLRMRFDKKTGFHNDDPTSGKQTDYVCGFLESYNKWVQRYGYFEARVKLPDVPGLWPTFWMMPDRGPAAGEQWKRQSTDAPGMELDIMEHLTRWGPYRYNTAMHWDGYKANHKAGGSSCNYVQHDKDGFMTVGMLWLPGSVVYYCNGKEIGRWEDPRICAVQSNIIFEVTTGGWDNNAVDDKQFPVDYVIDYVRVWQRKDLASSVDGYIKGSATQPAAK